MRWIPASERLGEFYDSDIPDWKFWHPGFCKVDGKPAERPFFRRDIEKGTVVFSFIYMPGSNFSMEIEEKDFHRVQWLDESTASNQEADYDDLHTVLWECGVGAQGTEAAIEELRKKFIITKKP
jgi:hypothetical protein